jgi:hypothetical protein
MKEKLLQFIWQHQYFNKSKLETFKGEHLQIINPGNYNTNQGSDFLDAIIKIDNITLAGNIELHVHSSDWNKHHHSTDKNYSNIILHVVWEYDAAIAGQCPNALPTLVLQNLVPKVLLTKYEQLMNDDSPIHCKKQLPVLNDLSWLKWKERLVAERLEEKSKKVLSFLDETNGHWEEVFWWMLASNFGIKVNTELFEEVARSISIQILGKHKNQIHQLESLLLGQANLLNENFTEDYPVLLQKEYQFLQKKYQLKKINCTACFLRMRPANFPTLRLAQLAMLVTQSSHLFATIKSLKEVSDVKKLFNITCNDYWHYHYLLDEASAFQPKKTGEQMVDNIIINTIIPVLFSYGLLHKDELLKEKALIWLSAIKAERNSITTIWNQANISCANALESQAVLQLHQHYCKDKKCLQCSVGNKLLKLTNEM